MLGSVVFSVLLFVGVNWIAGENLLMDEKNRVVLEIGSDLNTQSVIILVNECF